MESTHMIGASDRLPHNAKKVQVLANPCRTPR
jgi:hypothetical protein